MRNKENGNCSAAEYQVRIVIVTIAVRFMKDAKAYLNDNFQ